MIELPAPSKQLAFHQLLLASRGTVLRPALLQVLAGLDADRVASEISELSPEAARRALAGAGIRDELVFACPSTLIARPTLLGYYRLLLGMSQKSFYTADSGLSRFANMEKKNLLSPAARERLPDLCEALNGALADLVMQLSPSVTMTDLDELPLLTLGAQFDGSHRNSIGKAATEEVFLAIKELLAEHVQTERSNAFTITNSSGRKVTIALAADPDVAIREYFGGEDRLNVAIEIKGGTDRSNSHNRAGEAEKSHRKVAQTARDFWTLIATKGVDVNVLRTESPTTREWFDIAQVLARSGADWERFAMRIAGAAGI